MDWWTCGLGDLVPQGDNMASIKKRGKKYLVRWRSLEDIERGKTCPDFSTAKQVKLEVERALALGFDWRHRDNSEVPNLQVVFQKYLDDRARVWRDSTIEQSQIALTLFLRFMRLRKPRGRLMPRLLTRDALVGFHSHMTDVRDNIPRSANKRVQMVIRAWEWAFECDEEFGNAIPRPRSIDYPDVNPILKPWAPTWEMCDRVIEQGFASWASWYGRFLTVLRYTGLRKMQVMRLMWDDLDMQEALLTIRPELGKTKQERKGRIIPVTPHLIEAVAGWGPREGYLIKTRGKARRIDNVTLRRFWTKAGIKAKDLRQPCHGFRKALVSELTLLDVPERVIKALVGHAQGVTGDVYTDPIALRPAIRQAVKLIPKIGKSNVVTVDFRGRVVDKEEGQG